MKKHLILACLFVFSLQTVNARQGIAVANSYWENTGTWSFSGLPGLPLCDDTLTIPAGITVTVNSQQNYESCSAFSVIVEGTLQFTNGNKLSLPCNSCIYIAAGGTVKKATAGGGNSTFISICGTTQWKAADGPAYGPNSFCATLPISLLMFDAKPNHEKTDIYWTTASEINNEYFVLEQSSDGKNFNIVSRIQGAGNSNEAKEYHCTDYYPLPGISYYRLKQVDYDGKYSYSDLIAVYIKSKTPFNLISVETTINSTINLIFSSSFNDVCQLNVFELSGAPVFNMELLANTGLNRKEIYFPFLKKGIYLITLSNNEEVVTKKISLID